MGDGWNRDTKWSPAESYFNLPWKTPLILTKNVLKDLLCDPLYIDIKQDRKL